MYEGKKVSVVIATYREKRSIKKVIDDFFSTKFVDEVIIVNNNAESGTDEEVKKTKAKIFYEIQQGYGYAYRRAIQEATGDLIVVSEADATFSASDLERFLVYSRDFDVVLGTRTSQVGPLSSYGMGIMRKFANVLEAKTIEILFNSVALTDVGCTYKLFNRSALKKIIPIWGNTESALFNTQLVLFTVALNLKFVEIPISYNKRVGTSSIVGKWYQVIKWAVVIQFYILFFWFRSRVFKNINGKSAFN